jgi:hypothetical protein
MASKSKAAAVLQGREAWRGLQTRLFSEAIDFAALLREARQSRDGKGGGGDIGSESRSDAMASTGQIAQEVVNTRAEEALVMTQAQAAERVKEPEEEEHEGRRSEDRPASECTECSRYSMEPTDIVQNLVQIEVNARMAELKKKAAARIADLKMQAAGKIKQLGAM